MQLLRGTSLLAMAVMLGGAAQTPFWHTGRTASGVPFAIASDQDPAQPLMRFECSGGELVATVYGADEALQPGSRQGGGAFGPEAQDGAARMSLITDTVKAEWVDAEAVPNASAGWDMAIRLSINHPILLAFPRAEMIALVTRNGGTASVVEKGDRRRLAEFVRQCRASEAR